MSVYRELSIGSLTYNAKKKDNIVEYYENEISLEYQFDMESQYRFHDAIICRIMSLVYGLSLKDPIKAREYLKSDYISFVKAYGIWKEEIPPNVWKDMQALRVGLLFYDIYGIYKTIKYKVRKFFKVENEKKTIRYMDYIFRIIFSSPNIYDSD